jgi:hypothetical protein
VAKYGPDDLVIEFDNSGGTLQNMSQYIREINGVEIEAILTDSHAFGDTWHEALAVGVSKVGDITLKGFYDDTASTGPDVIFNAVGNTTTRTLKVTWGNTKTTSVETIIKKYSRMPKLDDLTGFEVILQPTGAVTEA